MYCSGVDMVDKCNTTISCKNDEVSIHEELILNTVLFCFARILEFHMMTNAIHLSTYIIDNTSTR